MTPIPYNMVDLDGLDLSTVNGTIVPGIYQKITNALSQDKIEIFYHWYYAGLIIPPSYVTIDDSVSGRYTINGVVVVQSNDRVSAIGNIPVLETLTVIENGNYSPGQGVTGFSSVSVSVPDIPSVLDHLSVTENGTYTPPSGTDGYDEVVVNVPQPTPVTQSLSVTQNGTYTPPSGVDGFNQVAVNVPQPTPVTQSLSVTQNGTYIPPSGVDGFNQVTVNVPAVTPHPALPAEYQEVEYLHFTPSIAIVTTIPSIANLLVSVKFSVDEDPAPNTATPVGYRLQTSAANDWDITVTGGEVSSYVRTPGLNTGITMTYGKTAYYDEMLTGSVLLFSPRTTMLVGRYGHYDTASIDAFALNGNIYEVEGFDVSDDTHSFWFIPCYRKADNVPGLYDVINNSFYYETYHTGSDYNIECGPDKN